MCLLSSVVSCSTACSVSFDRILHISELISFHLKWTEIIFQFAADSLVVHKLKEPPVVAASACAMLSP